MGVSVAVTSVLYIYAKFLLPAVALALNVLTGMASGAFVGASSVGILVLAVSLVLFGLVLWKMPFAYRIGNGFARAGCG